MSEEPSLFESIRRKRVTKRRVGFFSLSIMIRAALILTLGGWLMWKIYPTIAASAGRDSAPLDDTVTFSEPEDPAP
jgi:hypothetical protein